MAITRPVICDLWPAYVSGEASPETRAVIEEFLASDPEFARQLRENPFGGLEPPPLPPDLEVSAFARARRELRGFPWLRKLAVVLTALAFARIVSDTSWDVSPRRFIITAVLAAACWIAHYVVLWRKQSRVMVAPRRRRS